MEKNKMYIGDTSVTVENGKITSVSHEEITLTKDNPNFFGAITYVLVTASYHYKDQLIKLINSLDLSDKDYTVKALKILNDCNLSPVVSSAVNSVLNQKVTV